MVLDQDLLPQPCAPETLNSVADGGGGSEVVISFYDTTTGGNTMEASRSDASLPAAAAAAEPEPEPEPGPGGGCPAQRERGGLLHEDFERIPVRLSSEERELLSFLQGALHVSEYTDTVDVLARYDKSQRILGQMQAFCAAQSGLAVCRSFKKGSRLLRGEVADNAEMFQTAFEVGRRYKIMNPQKMRSDYGKLMCMLQDWASPSFARAMGFAANRPIVTVTALLEECGGLEVLRDSHLARATIDLSSSPGMGGAAADAARADKRRAAEAIITQHTSATLSADVIRRCLESIADSNNFLNMNASVVGRMLKQLETHFDPLSPEGYSLQISASGGFRAAFSSRYSSSSSYGLERTAQGGSKLSHSHSTQYTFVQQTLTLWREISQRMYKLWMMADADLLSTRHSYRLCNTGQGLNRLQSCPNVASEMSAILRFVQRSCGSWVGLSVVHLGDRDVPNALTFIDKYNQVTCILAPIVRCIEGLDEVWANEKTRPYIEKEYGSLHAAKMEILCDFFKHGFDGDGDDGGSCIDGRLTSAWNWCSKVEKKRYFNLFLLTGFVGFDGEFRD
jgi:hypothetical protein